MAAAAPKLDDPDLIRAVVDVGDDDAFTELVNRHGGAVVSRCRMLLGGSALADDAAQNAWVKIYLNLQHFRGDSSFRTWALTIAARECYTIARTARAFEEFIAPADEFLGADVAAHLDLRAGFQALPRADRIVLWLAHVDGYTFHEISHILGLTEASVKMRASRARKKVKAYVEA